MATTFVRSTALWILLAAASAWAAVDVEIRNGDKVTGTISPATETEILRFRVPKGAAITAKAAAAKKGLLLRVRLKDPNGAYVGGPVEGKSATFSKTKAEVSGLYSVEITSKDGVAVGDYSFAATWKSPTSYGGKLALAAAVPSEVNFSADAGATATLAVKKTSKKSAAAPVLATLTYPDATVEPLSGAAQKRLLDSTGDCVLAVSSATAGDATATVKIKPPKPSARKYALTSKAIGGGDGDTAFSAIVGPEGGPIVFPPVAPGQPGAELVGSGVLVPAGALPVGTSIVIATAPDIDVGIGQTGAGTTVAFGPDGLVFGTKSAPKTATVTIPFDPSFLELTDDVTIFTRNAKGVVTAVPKPYDFDRDHYTVSFQTSHFSSFRAMSSTPLPTGGNFFTVATNVDAQDVCVANDPTTETQTVSFFYVAEGAGRTVGSIYTGGTTTPFQHRTWVGGGTQTTLPAGRTQVQFVENVNTVFALSDGTLFVGTKTQIFRVDPTTGDVTLLAGTGSAGDSGDSGAAVSATFTNIRNVVGDESGGLFVADDGAHRIRFIDLSSGGIVAWAGNGTFGVGVDGQSPATTAFIGPSDMSFAPSGGLYVADGGRIRLINPAAAAAPVNVTVAGASDGDVGSTGDGGAPSAALFEGAFGLMQYFDVQNPTNDELAVVDGVDHTLRVLDFTGGTVQLLAGAHDTPGFNGDFGSTPGRLRTPQSVAGISTLLCVADQGNARVRLLFPGQ
jgi:hypothetical protein